VFVPFLVTKSKSTPRFRGGSQVLEALSNDGDKVLIIRGFNPTRALIEEVKVGELFEGFADMVAEVGRRRNARFVVVPLDEWWGLALTNRPYAFMYIKERYFASTLRVYVGEDKTTYINDLPIDACVIVRDLRPSFGAENA